MRLDLVSYTKVNSKWIRDLKVKAKTNKLIRKQRKSFTILDFVMVFRYDTRNTGSKRKKQINQTSSKVKTFVQKIP